MVLGACCSVLPVSTCGCCLFLFLFRSLSPASYPCSSSFPFLRLQGVIRGYLLTQGAYASDRREFFLPKPTRWLRRDTRPTHQATRPSFSSLPLCSLSTPKKKRGSSAAQKAKASRKSSAYHVAKNAALRDGLDQEAAKAKGREVPWPHVCFLLF